MFANRGIYHKGWSAVTKHRTPWVMVGGELPAFDDDVWELTPHSLRRTFASLLYAIGETPPYVMAQMGHTSPNLALAVYAQCMDRRDGEPERLKALVKGDDWARLGTETPARVPLMEVRTTS